MLAQCWAIITEVDQQQTNIGSTSRIYHLNIFIDNGMQIDLWAIPIYSFLRITIDELRLI